MVPFAYSGKYRFLTGSADWGDMSSVSLSRAARSTCERAKKCRATPSGPTQASSIPMPRSSRLGLRLRQPNRRNSSAIYGRFTRPVSLRVYADRLVVAVERQVICEHDRGIDRRHGVGGHDWRHYLAVLQRRPSALSGTVLHLQSCDTVRTAASDAARETQGNREIVEVSTLVLHHEEHVVIAAVEVDLDASVATKMHVLNIPHRPVNEKVRRS